MATVSNTLKLFDAMSKPLQNITNSMNLMLTTMQKMQQATDKNVKIDRSLMAAKSQLASAEAEIRKQIDNAAKSQEKFNKRVDQSHAGSNKLLSTVKSVAAAYVSLAAAKSLFEKTVLKAAEQQTILDTLAARTGSRAHGQAIFDTVTQQALKYGQDVNAALAGAQSFMSATMNPKTISQLNLLAMRLSKLNPAEGLEGAVFSLKELLSGDYTSIAERFNISRSMLKDSEARAAGLRGDVEGFIKGMDKLLNQQNLTQESFEKMLDSPAAKWNKTIETLKFRMATAGKKALDAFAPLLDLAARLVNSSGFETFIKILSDGLAAVAKLLSSVIDGVTWLSQLIRNNWPIIAGILAGIVTYFTIMTVQQIPLLIARINVLIASLWGMIAPIIAQAGAWLAVNWPIALVVLAVGLLVAAIVRFGVSTQEVIGFVVGLFYSLYAVVHNQFALLWNLVASYAEFLINVFIDPVYAVKKLFYDLTMTFGDYMYNMARSAEDFAGNFMKTILKAINKTLEGFNWLVDKINDMFGTNLGKAALFDENNIHAVSDGMKKIMDTLEKPISNRNVVSLARMNQMNLKDSFDSGYKVGFNATDKALTKMNSIFKNATSASNGFGDYKDIANVGKVGEVGKIKDTVDISSEDLKLMRELAEMKSIQNFVTYKPELKVTTGPVSKDVDINEIVARIERALEEDIAANGAGVWT